MATKSISIPAQLHQELKLLALWEGKTLKEMVTQLLKEGLERERAKQERLLREYYEEVATTSEYKEMVEDFLRATAEILPDDEWPEFQDE
jgi:hypothetical protein